MRTAIVMAYYNRKELLMKTLLSFRDYKDYHIIIVDDCSDEPLKLNTDLPVTIKRLEKKEFYNSVQYNIGFHLALELNPGIIIIQNPECYHEGDIIGYAEKHLTHSNYIAFGCYSLPKDSPLPPLMKWPVGASFDGEGAWYNHPIHRAVGYHFCTAITTDNLRKLNGFDERYAYGIGYDDSDLVRRIRRMGLRIDITSDPFVYHQWHYTNKNNDPFLIKKNADLFSDLKQGKGHRAIHIITPNL